MAAPSDPSPGSVPPPLLADLPSPAPALPASGALVLFAAGGALLALPQAAVRGLLPLPRLDAPPGLPAPLEGFLNLGGRAVPVVALAALLGLPGGEAHPYRHLILLDGARGELLALLVERAVDVLPAGLPLRPAEAGTSLGGLVTATAETPGGAAHLLDPGRILLAEEAAVLGALAAQARARLARWGAAGTPA